MAKYLLLQVFIVACMFVFSGIGFILREGLMMNIFGGIGSLAAGVFMCNLIGWTYHKVMED